MKIDNKKISISVIVFSVLIINFLFCCLINKYQINKSLQNLLYDKISKIKSKYNYENEKIFNNIVLVKIDKKTIIDYQSKKNYTFPWPRNFLVLLASHCINHGAKIVVFDILMPEPDVNRADSIGFENDQLFCEILSTSNKIIIPFKIVEHGYYDSTNTLHIQDTYKYKNIKEFKYLEPPYSLFSENTDNIAFNFIPKDKNNIIRNYYPLIKIKNKLYPSIASACYILFNKKSLPKKINLNNEGTLKLNWFLNINKNYFKYMTVDDVYNDYLESKKNKSIDQINENYKDKIFFFGSDIAELSGLSKTNLSTTKYFSNIDIHANALLNLLNSNWIKFININIELLIYSLIISTFIYLLFYYKSAKKYLLYYFILILNMIFIHILIYLFLNIELNSSIFLFFSISSYFTASIIYLFLYGFKKYNIIFYFKNRISDKLLKIIINNEKFLNKKITNSTATVMFIDIENFSKFTEKYTNDDILNITNLYLKKISDIIISNKGYINKYLGSGLMAIFGSPHFYVEHADMALKSAIECYNFSKSLFNIYNINIRIGINSGNIIEGFFINNIPREYTIIGNNVKIANKLEKFNKKISTPILVGENSYKVLKKNYNLNYLGNFIFDDNENSYRIYYYSDTDKITKDYFDLMIESFENKDKKNFKRYLEYFITNNVNFIPIYLYINQLKEDKNNFGMPIKIMI
ncbi:MAG: CHASE2 domain-containing protein [Spirochaetes bacterium]|nr:CHASE2 domain-containing protein [Spirochaetota bacterium]